MKSVALLIMGFLLTQASAQNLLLNGGFELPDLGTGSAKVTSIPGWTATTGLIDFGHFSNYGLPNAAEGDQFIDLDAGTNATVEQAIPTVPGTTYRLRYRFNTQPGPTGAAFFVLWNGLDMSLTVGNSNFWQSFELELIATSSLSTLAFQEIGPEDDKGALIDDVRLEAVPEPATMAILTTGLMLARTRTGRRRKRDAPSKGSSSA